MINGLSGVYENATWSKSTWPRTGFRAPVASGSCSGASSTSNTRSAEATPDCSRLAIDATWVRGWVNIRVYWMNACTSPRFMVPLATRRPPTTAMIT